MAGDPTSYEGPDFDDVFPDLDVAGRLIVAAAGEDREEIDELRDAVEADRWNVAWTLALLIRGVRTGEPAAVDLVDFLMSRENEPTAGG